MLLAVSHRDFVSRRLQVQPAGWLCPPRLLVDGVEVRRQARRGLFFSVQDDVGQPVEIRLGHRFLDPYPSCRIAGQPVALAPPLTWYQYAWLGLPLLLLGGGAFGGALGALAARLNGLVMRGGLPAVLRYPCCAAISCVAGLLYLIGGVALRRALGR